MSRINWYEEIEKLYGYFPTFHYDVIEKIEICNDKIIMTVKMETNPKNISSVVRIQFIFENVLELNLEGDGYINQLIIFEIEIEEYDFYTRVVVDGTTGLCGNIKAEKVQVKGLY